MNFLSTLRLSSRLAFGFGLVIVLLLGLASVALIGLHELALGLRTITEVNTARSQVIHEMETAVNHAVIGMRNLGITEDNKEEAADYKRLVEALARYDDADLALEKLLSATPADSKERALFAKVRESAAKGREIVKMAQDDIKAKGGTVEQIAFIIRLKLRTELAKWSDAQYAWSSDLRALNEHVTAESKEYSRRLDETSTLAQATVVAGALLALLLASTASIVITRSVTVPVAGAVEVMRKIARGELEEPIKANRKDEVGHMLEAFEEMRVRLHQVASRLHEATDQISTATSEIAIGNMDLSVRTEKTAATLQQAASAMAELTSAVQQSTTSALLANDLAQSASTVAARGGEVVSNLVRTMDGIDASSKKIGDIIGVIDGIAFQTNILALNAAVEAARAGEQGRGFAVVASEVRSLAQRSAQAAKEIKSLIGASMSQVQTGTQFAKDAGATMVEVVGSVDRVTSIIGEITSTTSQQSTGLGHVNAAVAEVDSMTQQNSALVEQSAAAAASLKEQAVGLTRIVGVFKLSEDAIPPAVPGSVGEI